MTLLELAERCEQATGPDRELDVTIWLALCGPADRQAYDEGMKISEQEAAFRADYMMDGRSFTASLDAAMTLVPTRPVKGLRVGEWWWMVESTVPSAHVAYENGDSGIIEEQGEAATPALALCAAALRARDASGTEAGTAETPSGSVHDGPVSEAETPNA